MQVCSGVEHNRSTHGGDYPHYFFYPFCGATLSEFCSTWRVRGPRFIFEKRVFDITDWFEQFGRVFFYVLAAGLAVYILYKYVRLRVIQKTLAAARITPEEECTGG